MLQAIATTPDAGKAAVLAHQALTRDTGLEEPRQAETQATVIHVLDVSPELALLLADMRARDVHVIDAEIKEEEREEEE